MADLVNFKQMLMAEAEQNGLPNLVLSQNTDLGQIASRIVGVDNRAEGESAAALAGRYVDEFTAALSEEANADILKLYEEVVAVFADKFNKVFGEIAAVKGHAAELAGEMERVKNDILARDPFVAAHTGLSTLNTDFPVRDWSVIGVVGSKPYIIGRVNGSVAADGAEVPEAFSAHHFNLAIDNLKSAERLQDVQFTPETRVNILETIKNACGEAAPADVEAGFDMLTIGARFNAYINALASKDMDPANIYKTIVAFTAAIENVYTVIGVIQSEMVDLGNSNRAIMDANIEKAKVICELMAYYIAMHRESTYAEALLLPDGALNKDTMDKFTQAGGTPIMVAHYIRAMFKDKLEAIPVRGVPVDSIINSATALADRVKRDIANAEGRISLATNKARVTAFKHVAGKYIINEVEQKFADKDPVAKTAIVEKITMAVCPAIVQAITMYEISFMDACLSLIMESGDPRSFAYAMFKKLGAAYVNRADLGGDIDQSAIDVVESKVIADFLSEFVVTRLCAYEDCRDMTVSAPVVPAEQPAEQTPADATPSQEGE